MFLYIYIVKAFFLFFLLFDYQLTNHSYYIFHYKQSIKTIIKIDLSVDINNKIFSQLGYNKLFHFIVFSSKNPNLAEYNYEIYNKELLAII